MKWNYISKPTQFLLHDHMAPFLHGYAHFVHVCDFCGPSPALFGNFCCFADPWVRYLLTLHITLPSCHYQSTHDGRKMDLIAPRIPSPGYQVPLSFPNQTDSFATKRKKVKYIVLNIWKQYPKTQFLQISSGSHWMFTTQQQISSSHTARSMLVILFTSFIQSSLWNAELLTTLMSVLKAHILSLSSKPF